ncbi:uncharacterized protein LOC129768710 [Toxorhynchites rutilus septentrionalis]|uniref:uncharacterized protein LOC129768710 n=1 Tax=Toxorhynchites rutilus septentrionalis TaxID=329112 RepID=UPI002478F396|nr:uncharacterized protein LOC129768710 [Toxorhynchites rutilus septentrionalis]
MKLCSVILVISCAFAVSQAAQAVLPNAVHPDHPGKCYDEDTKTALAPGKTKSLPGRCMEVYCSDNFTLTYTSCGAVVMDDPHCVKMEQDLTKDYPECCKKYKCVIDGQVSYF